MKFTNSTKLFAILTLTIVLVGIFLVTRFGGLQSGPAETGTPTVRPIIIATSTPESKKKEDTKPSAPSGVSASVALCVRTISNDIKISGEKYESGSLLVAFGQDVSFAEAVAILRSLNISFDQGTFNDQSYLQSKWTVGRVTPGKEIQAVCELREKVQIRYAELNKIITLHE